MKTLFLMFILLGVTSSGESAFAQVSASATPRPTPPPGPLLNKAPDFAAWTIVSQRARTDSQNANSKPASGKPPENVTTITKTNQTRHYVIRHRVRKIQDGSQEEVWQQGPYVVTHESMWQAAQLGFDTLHEETATADFPEFSWISAANFVGVQPLEGVPCLVFDATIIIGGRPEAGHETSKGTETNGSSGQVHERAYIDLETRLPRFLQNADVVSHYTFLTAPSEMLVLPAMDQEMINAYLKNTASHLQVPQSP